MDTVATLGLKLDASGVLKGTADVKRALGEVGGAAGQTQRSMTGLDKAATQLKAALAGLGVAALAREAMQMADAFKLIEGRLKLVTASTGQLVAVQRELFGMSQQTRTSFEATAGMYARVARNAKELGLSQREVLDFTKAVSQAIQVSGATSQEASAGVIQLSQALAAGQLRGDEFRSVMENLPGVARALAEGLGVPIGELRQMAEQGELTADTVVGAVMKMKDSIDRDFQSVPLTMGQAFTVVKNSVSAFVGELDRAMGASDALAKALTGALGGGLEGTRAAARAVALNLRAFGATLVEMVSIPVVKVVGALGKLDLALGKTFRVQAWQDGARAQIAWAEDAERALRAWVDAASEMPPVAMAAADGLDAVAGAAKRSGAALKGEKDGIDALTRAWIAAEAAAKKLRMERFQLVRQTGAVDVSPSTGIGSTFAPIAAKAEAERVAGAIKRVQAFLAEAAKAAEQVWKNTVENVQRTLADGFASIFERGLDGWRGFVDSIKRLFIRMAADLLAQRAMRALMGMGVIAATPGAAGAQGAERAAGAAASTAGWMGGALGAAGMGWGLGTMVGGMTTNRTAGAIGGAAAGAASGAIMGSAVPGIGNVLGAVIGGVTGAIAGLISSGQKARQELEAQISAQKALQISMAQLRQELAGGSTPLDRAISETKIQFEQLRRQAEAAYAGKKNEAERFKALAELTALEAKRIAQLKEEAALASRRLSEDLEVRRMLAEGRTVEAEARRAELAAERELAEARKSGAYSAEQLAELEAIIAKEREAAAAARAAAEAKQRDAFGSDLTRRRTALGGDDRALLAFDLAKKAAEELAAAQQLLDAGIITQEMFDELNRILGQETTKALEEFDKAVREAAAAAAAAAAAFLEDLDVRDLIAQGKDVEAEAVRFDIQQRREMAEAIKQFGEDSAQVKRLAEVQQRERERFEQQQRDNAAAAAGVPGADAGMGGGASLAMPVPVESALAQSAVGRATVEQADRMVGFLATIAVRAQRQVELLEVIAGQGSGDSALGRRYARAQSYTGSAVLN